MYNKQIDEYIEDHKYQILEDLAALIRIQSVKGEAMEGKPFGPGPAAVLAAATPMLSAAGMKVTNYDNYCITGDYGPGEKELDILAHLDVVPVSPQDWTVTAPFEPLIVGDKIYGRGSCDDKGPAVAALYAVKAIHELNLPLKKSVRLILGSDEETGSADLDYYYSKEVEAPWSFTPDASFPLINLEKGRLEEHFCAKVEDGQALPRVLSLQSGTVPNIVPARATAVIAGLSMDQVKEILPKVAKKSGCAYTTTETPEGICIQVEGLAAHASTPDQGKNALTALLELLSLLPLADCESSRILQGLSKKIPHGDTAGKGFGVAMSDQASGALTFNFGVLKMENGEISGNCDLRCPVCSNDENVTRVVERVLKEIGFTQLSGSLVAPHYVPASSPLVKTLLEVYTEYTGEKGEALAIGGGTYVHRLERGVAFGCEVEGVDNHMHGNDEFMDISVLLMSAKMFAQAILRLCG